MSPLQAAALVAAGAVIGVYATAIGAGGGFLITPLLLLRYGDASPELITTASLTVVAASTATSSLFVIREGRVDFRLVAAIATVAAPAALLGAAGTQAVPRQVFAAGFAALLLALAVYLAWRPVARIGEPARRAWRRSVVDREGLAFVYRIPVWRSIPLNIAGPFFALMAGIGGGVIEVPLMTRVMRVPHAIAVPSTLVLVALLTSSAVSFHILAGDAGAPMHDVPWLGLGVVAANPLGQRLRRRLGEGPLTRLLAAGLIVVAARTAWGAL